MNLQRIQIPKKPTYIRFAEDADLFSVFRNIEREFETCFIFESLGESERFSRYSIMGFGPSHIISARGNDLLIDGTPYSVANPYYALRDIMPQDIIARHYAGGLVGYLGYDVVNYLEPSVRVKTHEQFPPFMFGVYEDGLIHDKLTNELIYFHYGTDRSDSITKTLGKNIARSGFTATRLRDGLTEVEHASVVESVKDEIQRGNTFQCEVGFKTEFSLEGDTLAVYERLRETNPSPFMYYLKFGERKVIGASPELLFSLQDGEMRVEPLAGTTRRGADAAEDQRLARELLNDPKEVAEHSMLVDLHRNDLGRVAEFGTVKVTDLMTVKKLSRVQHIASDIAGVIRTGEDMFSGLAASFPAGTVSGAPKIESMKIIERNEVQARGPYGGGVGHFGFDGNCTFALAIRSLFVFGEHAYAQTSGGIVADSVPSSEYQEITRKLAATAEALGV